MERKCVASIYDIAADIGVSPGTVSRAINGHQNISESVRNKIIISSRKLGFIPRKRLGMIAVAVGDPSRLDSMGYIDKVIALLARELKKHNYVMQLTDLDRIDFLQAINLDAVIGVIFEDDIESLKKNFPRQLNLPILTINRPLLEEGFHSFCIDHRQGAQEATEVLSNKGHRKIAFLEAKSENWGAVERLKGYKDALANAGIEYEQSLTFYTTVTMLHDIVETMRKQGVTGVVNCSEDVALDFSHYLTNILKMRIPEEMSVVTVEIGHVQRYMSPPQTVISQPLKKLIENLANELDSIIKDKDDHKLRNVVLKSKIIERDSIGTNNVKR